jgi:hypothetical protein
MTKIVKLISLITQYSETLDSLRKKESPASVSYNFRSNSFDYYDEEISLENILENAHQLIISPKRLEAIRSLLTEELNEQKSVHSKGRAIYDDWVKKVQNPIQKSLKEIENAAISLYLETFPNAIAYKSSFPNLSIDEIQEIIKKIEELGGEILVFNHDTKQFKFFYSFEANSNSDYLIPNILSDKINTPVKIKKGKQFDIRDYFDLNNSGLKLKSHTHLIDIDMRFLIQNELILSLNYD